MVPSANARICAISARYCKRGLSKAVADSAKAQMEAEERTTQEAPTAYRLSKLSEAAITGLYRGGKKTMSSDDLVRYIDETMAMRNASKDFSDEAGVYEQANPTSEQNAGQNLVPVHEARALSLERVAKTPVAFVKSVFASASEWFDFNVRGARRETKKMPFSAFAAILAVAISLMLIVASSVMLTRAESRISSLTVTMESLTDEVADLQSDVNVQSNLLELREIAVEQYGMIDQRFLEMSYLDTQAEDRIDAYEEERDEGIGLSALLSALGIKNK